ncbi:uncharacterized protein LOC129792185 isoform X2 [Lutzomyia longipalpis]|nr:uncharacterized protein LOC129792185 isoform X2 [Lutzomyia longipalpis]
MDMNEISTISHRKQKITQRFCLRTSPCGRYYCLMLAGTAVINRIAHAPTADHASINFHVSQLQCPESIASQTLPRDLETIYEASTHDEKTSLVLNPLMCYKYAENISILLTDLQVSPSLHGRANELLIASQNSMGCVHFFAPPVVWRKWILVLDVAKELIERRHSVSIIRTYRDFEVAIEDHVISAFCWTMTNHERIYKFCVVVRSGVAIFCTFNRDRMEIEFESNLEIANVTKLHWFQFHRQNYLVAAAATGQIHLMNVDAEAKQCTSVAELWTDCDHLAVEHLEVNTEREDALLLFVKDCFLVTFVLNEEEKIFCRYVELGRTPIVGLTPVNSWEYLIICADRHTKLVRISATDAEIDIQELEVKSNLQEKYTFAGAVASPHRVFWMFAGELLEPHDSHNPAVSSVIVTTSTFIDGNCPLDILSRTSKDPISLADCQEALRIRWFKESDVDPYYIDLVAQPLHDDVASVINLRKRLIYLGARSGSLKYGYQAQALHFLEEFRYILRVLVVMHMHRNLLKLRRRHQVTNKLTKLQVNAVKHFKVAIREFLLTPIPEEYAPGLESLRGILEQTMQDVKEPKCILILCQLCQGEVNEDTLICADGHEMRRCVLTNFPIFILNEAICPQCNQLILKDRPILTEILLLDANEEIKCPICDVVVDVD